MTGSTACESPDTGTFVVNRFCFSKIKLLENLQHFHVSREETLFFAYIVLKAVFIMEIVKRGF